MGAAKKLIDKKALRDLVPIKALSAIHLDEISRKAIIDEVRSGTYVFKRGDQDNQTVYLLEGKVELIDAGRKVVEAIVAGSDAARHPLAHKQPRQLGARAAGPVTVARVDTSLLDVLLTWDESAGYDVAEIETQDGDDWMTRMLQSQAFLQLPPANIHQLLMRLEAVNVKSGDRVVRQGEDGDYFYIVKSGRLAVSRRASARGKEVLLAELGQGACFGEEALVSGATRNASVTMVTDGVLMQLSKTDFNELLCAPLVREADYAGALRLVQKGACWLDVRLPGEYGNEYIEGSVNVPLSALREHCTELDSALDYILCCDTGRRSAAAAFVLSQRGFSVYTLKDGLMGVPEQDLARPNSAQIQIAPNTAKSLPAAQAAANDDDAALIDRLAESENEKLELQQQLRLLKAQIENQDERARRDSSAEEERAALQQTLDAAAADLEVTRTRALSVENEKQQLQNELSHLQQTLARIQASAEGRHEALAKELELTTQRLADEQAAYAKQRRELQQDLERLREDHAQLGQRTSAVAGERDAAVKDAESVRQQLVELQASLENVNANQEQLLSLQRQLAEREQIYAEQASQSRSLRDRLAELEQQLSQNEQSGEQALARLRDTAATEQAALQSRLTVLQQQHEQAQSAAGAERDQLSRELESARQLLAERDSRQGEQQTHYDAAQQQLAELRQALDDRQAQLLAEADRREAVETDQQSIRLQLSEAATRAREADGALERSRNEHAVHSGELQSQIEQAHQRFETLNQALEQAQQQRSEAEKRVADLDVRLVALAREHENDIASTRTALARSQTETENSNREQSRLLESLRKAERDLERGRQDFQSETLRLRKELKQAAGESNAGLAAELEALQNRIRDDARERDELELRLGERSAQYEAVFAEARKLQQQLEQAQASARQAEQQLVEANQQANQEMTVRIEAEEKAQQALRGELATIIGERNRYQEQLDAVRTSMDELGAQSAALGKRIQTVEQERDSALESQLHTRQELEKLTAAAEAWRDAGAVTDRIGDAVLSAQLEQARQSVNEAERLRQQAESKISSLEARIQQLVTGQKQADVGASDLYDFDEIESFKETSAEPEQSATGSENSGTTVWLGEEQQNSSATDLLAEDGPGPGSQETHADLAVPDVLPAQTAEGGGRKGLLLVALVGLAAGGWWLNRPQVDMPTVKIAVEEPPLETEILKPEPESQPPVAVATDVPAEVEQLVPAAENDSPVLPVHDDHKSVMPDKSVVQQPAPEVVVPTQPVRSFSDALSAGGHGPKMVEFYAAAYAMGSGASSPNFDERPRHQVQLKRFALSADEVTFADYDRFTSDTGRRRPGDAGWGRGNRPVINVHWGDALAYTLWLSAQTGQRYRLPTEAEWEFAARSGAESRYWWGNSLDTGHANCFDCGSEWSGRSTAPVGSLAASPYGVSDMSGNVMEWTQDCYRINYDGVPTDGSAVEDGDCSRRVVRGGAYDSPSDKIRASSRDSRAVDAQLDNLGFRVVKEF